MDKEASVHEILKSCFLITTNVYKLVDVVVEVTAVPLIWILHGKFFDLVLAML